MVKKLSIIVTLILFSPLDKAVEPHSLNVSISIRRYDFPTEERERERTRERERERQTERETEWRDGPTDRRTDGQR